MGGGGGVVYGFFSGFSKLFEQNELKQRQDLSGLSQKVTAEWGKQP